MAIWSNGPFLQVLLSPSLLTTGQWDSFITNHKSLSKSQICARQTMCMSGQICSGGCFEGADYDRSALWEPGGEGAQICGESGRKWAEFLILLLQIELDNTTTCSGYPKCAVKPASCLFLCNCKDDDESVEDKLTTPSIDDNLITRPSRKICRDATK